MDERCPFCKKPFVAGGKSETCIGSKGLISITAFSKKKNDGLAAAIKGKTSIRAHTDCRKDYTRRVPKDLPPAPTPPTPKSERRKKSKLFKFDSFCLFCERPARRWEKCSTVKLSSSPDFDNKLEATARGRKDDWGYRVLGYIEIAGHNLGEKRARYHRACFARFHEPACKLVRQTTPAKTPLRKVSQNAPTSRLGRPQDPEKSAWFNDICAFIEQNNDCQFSLLSLLEQFPEANTYGDKQLKRLLIKEYPHQLHFTATHFTFTETATKLLNSEWYRKRQDTEQDERLRIVKMAARIISEDIRRPVYDVSSYPTFESMASGGAELIPSTLKRFVDGVVRPHKRGKDVVGVERKCVALCQGLMAACRPNSYLSPLHVGLAVDLHRRYGSRSLVDSLNALGHCSSYTEAVRFGASVVTTSQAAITQGSFSQFVMDNADFNVRTLTGHGTFHVMGAIVAVTPAAGLQVANSIPRKGVSVAARDRRPHGTIPIKPFVRTNANGLSLLRVRDLRPGAAEKAAHKLYEGMDLLWLTGRVFMGAACPGWSGFMELAAGSKTAVDLTAIVPLPFINLQATNPSAIYTGLLFAVDQCRENRQDICVVTFDQPLFQKAIEMILQAGPNSDLKTVVLRLGTFHMDMSFILALGKILGGSGIEELFSTVYARNAVSHMLTGKAYARAVRALTLAQAALFEVMMADQCSFTVRARALDAFKRVQQEEIEWTEASMTSAAEDIRVALQGWQEKETGRTAALWHTFFEMVGLLKTSIAAERLGDWDMHLAAVKRMLPYFHSAGCLNYARSAHIYLQQLENLEQRMDPIEYHKYIKLGYFTLRLKNAAWSGNETDKIIEQTLMKEMKSVGGLTRGRGVAESTLATWIHTAPVCSKVREAVELFTGTSISSSEQHVELRESNKKRNLAHYEVFRDWFRQHNPCSQPPDKLVALHSGLVGDATVNCDKALSIGMLAIEKIVGQNFSDVKLSRSGCVRPLSAMTRGIKVGADEIAPVDVNQLFHRLVVLLQQQPETEMLEIFSHELAPVPAALFDDNCFMRVGTKSALVPAIEAFCPGDSSVPPNRRFILDGGFLLRVVPWSNPSTFGEIIGNYIGFVRRHYGEDAIVVFDGYEAGPQTKDEMHLRRGTKSSSDYVVEASTICSAPQAEFLSNKNNKIQLIRALSEGFQLQGHTVIQATADADTLIVQTALREGPHAVIVGNDTDLLAILIGATTESASAHFLVPGTAGQPNKVHHSKQISEAFSDVSALIPFVHAMTGCDTTSAIFKRSKKQAILNLKKSAPLREKVAVFNDPGAKKEDIIAAGEEFILSLYPVKRTKTLNEARVLLHTRSVAKGGVRKKFKIASLPPTSDAAGLHSQRVYHQVQVWRGVNLDPLEWGWKQVNNSLRPIPSTKPAAPEALLKFIYCNCRSGCAKNCECKRHGLKCSQMCGHCAGTGCTNAEAVRADDGDVDNDAVDEDGVDDGAVDEDGAEEDPDDPGEDPDDPEPTQDPDDED